MIARPKISRNERKSAERGAFEGGNFAPRSRLAKLDCVIAGDDVANKKPDPEIYDLAAKRLGVDRGACVVVEDSLVGLRAAKAAGMRCVVTYTASTAREDFYAEGADAKLPDMSAGVDATMLFADGKPRAELLADLRDAA